MTVPVVYSACEAYPTVRFVIATQPVASSLFVNPPQNLTVVGVDVKQRYKGTHGIWRLMGDLRREYAIDAFIDLHDVIRTHIMGVYCRMHGIPMSRIDKGRSEKRELTRETGKNLHPLISTRQRYFDAFKRMGFDFGETFTSVYPSGADTTLFADITKPKSGGERWIAIAPFAKHEGKIYPPGLMSLVVDTLSQRDGTRLFLFGGGGHERAILEEGK